MLSDCHPMASTSSASASSMSRRTRTISWSSLIDFMHKPERSVIAGVGRRARRVHPAILRLVKAQTQHAAETIGNCGVYAVTVPGCGRIKIGYTTSLQDRLEALETGSPAPLDVLAFIRGDFKLEARLHVKLWNYCEHREWFRDCPEVRETLIAAAQEHGGIWLL